jgi:hypothetical protein
MAAACGFITLFPTVTLPGESAKSVHDLAGASPFRFRRLSGQAMRYRLISDVEQAVFSVSVRETEQ